MSFLDIAQPLAAKGIPQTPIRPGTKRAFLLDFPTTATTDVTKLTEWNATYSDCGSASVARAEEGGIFIFETDSPDVIARIKADTGQDLMSIPTFRVRSREGRGHSYFKHTAWTISNLPNISQTYVIGQDWSLRANREYCVSAGSLHPETGKPYTALNDNPIAEAPEWLIKWMLSQKIQQSYNGTGKKDNTPRNANGKVPHGSLHGFMLSQAGRLRRAGCNQEEIETALLRIVHEQCEPPIDDAKVIQMSKSICNFPQGNDAQQQFAQQDAPEEKPLFTLPVSTIMASKVLGELYQQVFAPNDWPVELALPALVTAASALVPERKTGQIMLQDNFTHLYTALIGDMHVGKSQVIDWAVSRWAFTRTCAGSTTSVASSAPQNKCGSSCHRTRAHSRARF